MANTQLHWAAFISVSPHSDSLAALLTLKDKMFYQVFRFKFHLWSVCVWADSRVNPTTPTSTHLTPPVLQASDHGPLPAEGGGPPWGPAVSVMAHLSGCASAAADGWWQRQQQRVLPGQPAAATDRWADREGIQKLQHLSDWMNLQLLQLIHS